MLKVQPGRDSYERKDYYNCQGIAAYYILKFRKIMQDAGVLRKESDQIVSEVSPFGMPLSPSYMFEIMQPVMEIALRAESETMKNLATENLKILAFLSQTESNSL
jgi:hypothetical protein